MATVDGSEANNACVQSSH